MKHILFRSYMGAMMLIAVLITAILVIFAYSSLLENIESGIRQANANVAVNVDNQVKQMDNIALSALYSNLLKSSFSSYLTDRQGEVESTKVLHDLMFSIIGVSSDARQITLYNLREGSFGTGWYNGYMNQNLPDMPWYAETLAAKGGRYVKSPYASSFLSSTARAGRDRQLVSLSRMYFDQYNRMDGAVEVIQYYDVVFHEAIYNDNMYAPRFYIYDDRGAQLYAPGNDEPYDYLSQYTQEGDFVLVHDGLRNEFVCFERMPYTRFVSVAAVNVRDFYGPIVQFLLLVLGVLAGALSVCYFAAKRLAGNISAPIAQIHEHLSSIDFAQAEYRPLDVDDNDVIEIGELNRSINTFQTELVGSMENILLLQRQEAQSYMLALQAQMNPHFLYNSLATITAMAYEGMTDEIAKMSSAISNILRYISSNTQSLVQLEEEFENVDLYLNCLKFRHAGSLTYLLEADDALLHVMVPKLCVQLLVENAVKFTTKAVMPPWHVAARCVREGDNWIISVSDNGGGFTEETLASLRQKIDELDRTNLLPSLELQGMGLLNVYMRLRLLYRDDYIFEFGNNEGAGAFVRIGGAIIHA